MLFLANLQSLSLSIVLPKNIRKVRDNLNQKQKNYT